MIERSEVVSIAPAAGAIGATGRGLLIPPRLGAIAALLLPIAEGLRQAGGTPRP